MTYDKLMYRRIRRDFILFLISTVSAHSAVHFEIVLIPNSKGYIPLSITPSVHQTEGARDYGIPREEF